MVSNSRNRRIFTHHQPPDIQPGREANSPCHRFERLTRSIQCRFVPAHCKSACFDRASFSITAAQANGGPERLLVVRLGIKAIERNIDIIGGRRNKARRYTSTLGGPELHSHHTLNVTGKCSFGREQSIDTVIQTAVRMVCEPCEHEGPLQRRPL